MISQEALMEHNGRPPSQLRLLAAPKQGLLGGLQPVRVLDRLTSTFSN